MSSLEKKIKIILSEAVRAPSGDNLQPWYFSLLEDSVQIFLDPKKDNYFFNCNNIASLLAIGALVENIVIVASKYGLASKVVNLPDKAKANLVAKVRFSSVAEQVDQLYEFVRLRKSSRKPYDQGKVFTKKTVGSFKSLGKNYESKLFLVLDNESISKIARAATSAEKTVLTNTELRKLFFDDVRWTDAEERREGRGLSLRSLDLNPVQKLFFRMYSYAIGSKILNKLKFSSIITSENSKLYASSSAYGGISINRDSPEMWIDAGRHLQRVWLTATKLNISLQVTSGVVFLNYRIKACDHLTLTDEQVEDCRVSAEIISNYAHDPGSTVAIIFRMGYSEESDFYTSRLEPNIV